MFFSLMALALVGALSTASSIVIFDLARDIKGIANNLDHQVGEVTKEIAPALKPFNTPPVRVVSPSKLEEMDRGGTKLASHWYAVDKDDQSIRPAPVGFTTMDNPMTSQKYNISAVASCASNPNVRFEWRDFSNTDCYALVNGIKCLMNKQASGKFPPARNRYEDFVRVYQQYVSGIHNNAKFLLWHRYFLWTFEQVL